MNTTFFLTVALCIFAYYKVQAKTISIQNLADRVSQEDIAVIFQEYGKFYFNTAEPWNVTTLTI